MRKMMTTRYLLIGAASLRLSACAAGPDYVPRTRRRLADVSQDLVRMLPCHSGGRSRASASASRQQASVRVQSTEFRSRPAQPWPPIARFRIAAFQHRDFSSRLIRGICGPFGQRFVSPRDHRKRLVHQGHGPRRRGVSNEADMKAIPAEVVRRPLSDGKMLKRH